MSVSELFTTPATRVASPAILDGAAPLVGRLLLAAIFILSGVSKAASPDATIGYIASAGAPFPEVAYVVALVAELVGGAALVLGVQTRLAALALAVFSVAAAVLFHNDLADQNQFIHFYKNLAMAGGLLQVVAFGAGRYSVDALRS